MPTPSALPDFFNDLRKHIAGELRTDAFYRTLYSTDASIYQMMPYGVLRPKTVDDVQAALELAARYRIPILPRTAGTSLAGQAINAALVIDFTPHLNRILEVNAEERWVRVQPGVVLDHLNRHLHPLGLQYGPDPASSNRAAMGGIVANNSTGSHSILYGMTADHVLGMDVLLSDGSPARFGFLTPEELAAKRARGDFEGNLYRKITTLLAESANRRAVIEGTPRHWRRCGGYNVDRLLAGSDSTAAAEPPPLGALSNISYRIPQDPRFNLAKLIAGSEGTLAVMTAIQLNLVPRPKMTAIAVVQFDDLHTALSAVPVILETGPSAVELVDQIGLTRCLEAPQYARLLRGFLEGTPNCILITEFYGESEAELRSKVDRLQTHLRRERAGSLAVTPIFDPQAQQDIWTVRKVALGFLMGVEGDFKPIAFIEDAAVPVEHLSGYIRKLEAFCRDIGTPIAYYAHASAGCLHVRPMVNTKKAEEIAKLPQIVDFAVDLLRGYGGALSSEHGDGRTRSWANEKFFGPDLYRVYREVKAAFDPQNLLNPGNIVNAPAMTENLRYGADYRTLDLKLHLDFSDYGAGGAGFARAVEQCNGAGVCRKEGTGTMCPSYMATRDEAYSTRARANALRAALSGVLPPEALTSERMYEIMDLCVSCKSCKAECPSAVDMARLKFEFLAHYYEKHGIPLRARLFANIHRISRIASGPWAPLVNALMASRPMRALLEAALGISKQRVMPPFARQPFTRWFSTRSRGKTLKVSETFRVSDEVASSEADKGALSRPDSPLPVGRGAGGEGKRQLVLFNDTFNTYNTPEVAIAATEVFEAAGFEVILPGHKCCGRPAISKGLVELARSLAQDTVERLYPFAEQGLPIVGLEPSCLLTLRDEYFHLLPDDPRVPVVAEHCYTFEEFIAKLEAAGELNLPLKRPAAHFLHHGHCHQKALVGTAPGVQTLNLIPGAEVEDTDAGCCGMAGAFGYEAEHYEISMKMGEQRLFPAVRAADDDTIIVAAGTSCRHQIADGTGKRALHPAEVLRHALPQ